MPVTDRYQQVAEVLEIEPTITHSELARRLGIDIKTVKKHRHRWEQLQKSESSQTTTNDVSTDTFTENADGSAVAIRHTEKPIRTLEEAVAAAEIDQSVWFVERWQKRTWTVAMRVRQGQDDKGRHKPDEPIQTVQHGVQLWLRRIVSRSMEQAIDAVFLRMAKHAPKYPKIAAPKKSNAEPMLGVVGLFDVHFGKLAWAPETGENYDLRIAETMFRNAVDDLIAESSHRNIVQWVFPIGNDAIHIDNARNMTFNGTPQDVDGRYAKVIEAAVMAYIWAVERLMIHAPVVAPWIPGNHDPTTSLHVAREIKAWFRQCDRVEVDTSPSPRKYIHWNSTLLGLTHGNEEKKESLPSLMSTERPREWADSKCREWLLGHDHRSRQWVTKPVDSHEGTVIRVLRSLAGTDAWHHRKGYIGGKSSAEVYFYGRDRGYAGHAVALARA